MADWQPVQFFLLVFALSVVFWLLGAVTDLQLLPGLPISALALFCPGDGGCDSCAQTERHPGRDPAAEESARLPANQGEGVVMGIDSTDPNPSTFVARRGSCCDRPMGSVSELEWQMFLRDEVTQRFPAGLTVWEADGQWRTAAGSIDHEQSKILLLVHPDTAAARESVQAVIEAYRKKFEQQSVLWESARVCVAA